MTLLIRNLRLKTRIGVSEQERSEEQDIIVNVSLDYDADAACRLDSIEHGIDYRQLRDRVVALVQSGQFRLIETLVRQIVLSLSEDLPVSRLRVEVEKPRALRLADSVSASESWERAT